MGKVIGLTGLAGSGKSTIAKYLVDVHGYTLLSFAGPLKKMHRTLDPYMGMEVTRWFEFWKQPKQLRLSDLLSTMTEGEIKKSTYGPEYRRLLQTLGTDCVRAVEPDFWVNAAIAQMTDPNGKYVFDDVRFPNEAEVLRGLNPMGLWNVQRLGLSAVGGHISEQHAGNMGESVVIHNTHIDTLYPQVDKHLMSDPSTLVDIYAKTRSAIKHFGGYR